MKDPFNLEELGKGIKIFGGILICILVIGAFLTAMPKDSQAYNATSNTQNSLFVLLNLLNPLDFDPLKIFIYLCIILGIIFYRPDGELR